MEEKEQIDGRSLRGEKLYKATHDLLLESAVELLNDPKLDPEKVTLSQIAKNCNLSQAVAYKHFPDRMMDVYGSVVGKRTAEMLEEMQVASLKEKDPIILLEKMIAIFTEASIDTGNATRIAYANRHILLREDNTSVRIIVVCTSKDRKRISFNRRSNHINILEDSRVDKLDRASGISKTMFGKVIVDVVKLFWGLTIDVFDN